VDELSEEFERLIRPIRNAAAPGTLAALNLAVLKVGGEFPQPLKYSIVLGAIMFLLSAFCIFFYSIYPTRKTLWTGAATTFLLGLLLVVSSAVALLFAI